MKSPAGIVQPAPVVGSGGNTPLSASRIPIVTPTRPRRALRVGAQIWRTDEHGTITITFTGQGPVVASER